jgi:hypothetical protein
MVTGGVAELDVQWALHGKDAHSGEYDILAWSTGALDRANFADAISRFHLGELSTLPQVAVSYARLGDQPAVGYLALAIDEFGAHGRWTAHDRIGRPITYTRYFCLPYQRMAELAVGYLSTYEALRRVKLPEASGPPLRVRLAAPTARLLGIDPLAMRVAALLLVGRPVCILGADATSIDERLRFIDTVMDLLPYGLRARMTAATWTRATHGGHRFRLFFSSAPRQGSQADHVVTWGEPDGVPVPDGPPAEYLGWLEDNVGSLARLADLTGEMGFSRKDALQVLETTLATRHRFHFQLPALRASTGPVAAQDPAVRDPASKEPPPALVRDDAGEAALRACAEHAKLANPTRLRSDIALINGLAEGEIDEDRRQCYQDLITRLGLLRHDIPARAKDVDRLYDALLRMAFGTPLGYHAYCRVERCTGITVGDPPHQELLAALVRAGLADPLVSAIVHWHLRRTDEKNLNRWLVSGEVDPVQLINLLARDWRYPQHARIVCDVTLEYLKRAPRRYVPLQVRLALREHGFLARALQKRHPDEDQYQVDTLHQFLTAAYPQSVLTPGRDLSRNTILQILNGSGPPPTPALLSAVLMLVNKPGTWQLAWRTYVNGSVTLQKLDESTLARVRGRLPHVDTATIAVAPEPQTTNPARPGGDMIG